MSEKKKRPKSPPKPKCSVCSATLLNNGTCRWKCPPEANKKHLKSIDKKVRDRQRRADRGDVGGYLTAAESSAGRARVVPSRILDSESLAAHVRGDVRSNGWVKR